MNFRAQTQNRLHKSNCCCLFN